MTIPVLVNSQLYSRSVNSYYLSWRIQLPLSGLIFYFLMTRYFLFLDPNQFSSHAIHSLNQSSPILCYSIQISRCYSISLFVIRSQSRVSFSSISNFIQFNLEFHSVQSRISFILIQRTCNSFFSYGQSIHLSYSFFYLSFQRIGLCYFILESS